MFLIQRHGLKQEISGHLPVPTLRRKTRHHGTSPPSHRTGRPCRRLLFGAIFYLRNSHLVPVFKLTVTCLVWAGYPGVAILQLQGRLVTRRHAIASILLFLLALLAPLRQSLSNLPGLADLPPEQTPLT